VSIKNVILPSLLFAASIAANSAHAAIYTLTHDNSSTTIDDSTFTGVSSWLVDGTEHLSNQLFWYRVGSTGGESTIDTLQLDKADQYRARSLELTYSSISGTDFEILIDFSLLGGTTGSGVSDLAENIRITNTSTTSDLDFHFFQFANFDLNGSSEGDTVEQLNANTVRQTEGNIALQETVGTPAPSHVEMANFPSTLLKFQDDSITTTLNDEVGPISGDVTWAWQWDFLIAPGDAVIISKDLRMEVVPLPPAVWLFGSGLLGLIGIARKKSA
jgi:hypothetical protein